MMSLTNSHAKMIMTAITQIFLLSMMKLLKQIDIDFKLDYNAC